MTKLREYLSGKSSLTEYNHLSPGSLSDLVNVNRTSRQERMDQAWQDFLIQLESLWMDVLDEDPDIYDEADSLLKEVRNTASEACRNAVGPVELLTGLLQKHAETDQETALYLSRMEMLQTELEYICDVFDPESPSIPGAPIKTKREWEKSKRNGADLTFSDPEDDEDEGPDIKDGLGKGDTFSLKKDSFDDEDIPDSEDEEPEDEEPVSLDQDEPEDDDDDTDPPFKKKFKGKEKKRQEEAKYIGPLGFPSLGPPGQKRDPEKKSSVRPDDIDKGMEVLFIYKQRPVRGSVDKSDSDTIWVNKKPYLRSIIKNSYIMENIDSSLAPRTSSIVLASFSKAADSVTESSRDEAAEFLEAAETLKNAIEEYTDVSSAHVEIGMSVPGSLPRIDLYTEWTQSLTEQPIRTSTGELLGTISIGTDGRLEIRNKSNRYLGEYDPKSDETKDATGRLIGKGNILTTLLVNESSDISIETTRPSDCYGYARITFSERGLEVSNANDSIQSIISVEEESRDKDVAEKVYDALTIIYDVSPKRIFSESRVIPALYRLLSRHKNGESIDEKAYAQVISSLRPSVSINENVRTVPQEISLRLDEDFSDLYNYFFSWSVRTPLTHDRLPDEIDLDTMGDEGPPPDTDLEFELLDQHPYIASAPKKDYDQTNPVSNNGRSDLSNDLDQTYSYYYEAMEKLPSDADWFSPDGGFSRVWLKSTAGVSFFHKHGTRWRRRNFPPGRDVPGRQISAMSPAVKEIIRYHFLVEARDPSRGNPLRPMSRSPSPKKTSTRFDPLRPIMSRPEKTKCKNCRADVRSSEKVCPACGQKNPNYVREARKQGAYSECWRTPGLGISLKDGLVYFIHEGKKDKVYPTTTDEDIAARLASLAYQKEDVQEGHLIEGRIQVNRRDHLTLYEMSFGSLLEYSLNDLELMTTQELWDIAIERGLKVHGDGVTWSREKLIQHIFGSEDSSYIPRRILEHKETRNGFSET